METIEQTMNLVEIEAGRLKALAESMNSAPLVSEYFWARKRREYQNFINRVRINEFSEAANYYRERANRMDDEAPYAILMRSACNKQE